jgi:hypothetical protein
MALLFDVVHYLIKAQHPKNVMFWRLATSLFLVKQDRKYLECVIFVACLVYYWPSKFFNILLTDLELSMLDFCV